MELLFTAGLAMIVAGALIAYSIIDAMRDEGDNIFPDAGVHTGENHE